MDRAAVFDVDGTLVDTNHLHVTAWWEAFRQAGHRVPMHAVHRAVGLPSAGLWRTCSARTGTPAATRS